MARGRIGERLSPLQVLYLKAGLVIVLLIIFMAGSYGYVTSAKSELRASTRRLTEFTALMKRYEGRRQVLQPLKARLVRAGGAASPVTVVEEIGSALGIKKKISSFKEVEETLEDGYEIRGVEVSLKGLTLNEFVNLVYEIDRYPGLLLVKDLELETGFENNKEMDCVMKVLLVRRTEA